MYLVCNANALIETYGIGNTTSLTTYLLWNGVVVVGRLSVIEPKTAPSHSESKGTGDITHKVSYVSRHSQSRNSLYGI